MKEVIILILLLTLFQTFVLLYCQNKNKYNNCNCKQTENYSPTNDCYTKDENGTYVLDKYGIYNKSGGYEKTCYCNQPYAVGCYAPKL
jgi:hypothetical protein